MHKKTAVLLFRRTERERQPDGFAPCFRKLFFCDPVFSVISVFSDNLFSC